MREILILGLILALLGGPALPGVASARVGESASQEEPSLSNQTEEDDLLSELKTVHGKRGRRLFRVKRWAALLRGDMKSTYETYGYPSSRYREEVMGRMVERWTYLEAGRQFTFSDGRLVRERRFAPRSP